MSRATIPESLSELIEKEGVTFVDLRFTDLKGKEHHITLPVGAMDADFFQYGKMFDGSSFEGWRSIHESDMVLMPDVSTAVMDPFFEAATLVLRCDVLEPNNLKGYDRDPRTIAKRAEAYLKTTGIATEAYFGPEPEFFIFDDVRFQVGMNSASYHIDSKEAAWNSNTAYEGGNLGHRTRVKGGYFPVPPVDASHELRALMCEVMGEMGLVVEAHHHEVATASQNEIATRFAGLLRKADEVQILKYVIQNVAHQNGKTATFMPKPLVGDNGSGMHCHQSLSKNGKNIFAGKGYAGLSDEALYYIGGIIHHAKALNAFTNPTTNSYKRLVPGFEAPVLLAYSACNRSASIRVPHVPTPSARRIEVRFPDPAANPYLAFSAMMMAGLDGITKKIHPGEAIEKDLYHLPEQELAQIPTVAGSLEEALNALEHDHAFLLHGGVFTEDMLATYIRMKRSDAKQVSMATHPLEFMLYFSV